MGTMAGQWWQAGQLKARQGFVRDGVFFCDKFGLGDPCQREDGWVGLSFLGNYEPFEAFPSV